MEVAIFVACLYALQTVISHHFDILFRRRGDALRDNLIEILLHKLKDKEETVFLTNHLFQLDDVVVVEFTQRLDLSQLHCFVPRGKLCFHFLDGHDFICQFVPCLGHATKRTISYGLNGFVLLHGSSNRVKWSTVVWSEAE